jgi:hypothetical protein
MQNKFALLVLALIISAQSLRAQYPESAAFKLLNVEHAIVRERAGAG